MKPTGRLLTLAAGLVAVVVIALAAYLAWPRIKFAYLFESLGLNAQGYPEYRHRQTGIVVVRYHASDRRIEIGFRAGGVKEMAKGT